MLEVEFNADTTFELKLNPAAFKLPPVMLALVVMSLVEFSADNTFELRLNPAAFKLPPVTLALVVMSLVEFNADKTFELRLNPAAFRLPPLILAVVVIALVELIALRTLPLKLKLPVSTPELADKVTAEITLAPVMFPLAPDVSKFDAITLAEVVMLLVELISLSTLPLRLNPPVLTLAPVMLPLALTVVPKTLPLKLAALTLAVVMILPGADKLPSVLKFHC